MAALSLINVFKKEEACIQHFVSVFKHS